MRRSRLSIAAKDRGRGAWENITGWLRPLWPGSPFSCNTTSPSPKPGAPFLEATVRYFSFVTILTNILVALALTLPWLSPDSKPGRFFTQPSVRTAILTYIIIVAVIYHHLPPARITAHISAGGSGYLKNLEFAGCNV